MKKTYLFAALLMAGCHGVKQQNDNGQVSVIAPVTTGNPVSTTAAPTERPVYRATETVLTDLINTKLEVSFDWSKSQMTGKETLTAKPHFYATNQLILDAKGMEIKGISLNEKPLTYTYADNVLTITLDRTYQRTEQYTVVIDYIAKPNERTTDGSQAITSDKGLYFINPTGEDPTKMPQIWTQGETEASSVWFPTIDSPNTKSKQEMFITVDPKYVTLSNGKFLGSQKNADGTRTDHWKQDLPHAPYLFMMGVGEFKVVKDSWKRADGTTMDVNYYVEPEWEAYGKDIFGETPSMLEYFSKLLGVEYQWDKFDQIIVREYVSGAMENTGCVVFGDYAYKTDRELLDENDNSTIAHELFHHWFGDLVTAESWSNLPLNESFANYSQYLWDEHRYGVDEADYNANNEMNGYLQTGTFSGYHNLIWFDYEDKEDMFDGHSYNKGGRILHLLRNYIGDEAFFLGLQHYLKDNSFKAAEYNQLRIAFEDVCGEDLNWFFNQWFLASGHPTLTVKHSVSGSNAVIDIRQTQDRDKFPIFRLPVDVIVYDDNGETKHRIIIDETAEHIELPYKGTLKNVLFDSPGTMLGIVKEEKDAAWYLHQYYNGKRWKARKAGLENGVQLKNAASARLIMDALSDPFWDIRMDAIDAIAFLDENDRAAALSRLKTMAANDPNSLVRASALISLTPRLTEAEAQPILTERIQLDSSYLVMTTALSQLTKINVPLAMKLAKPLEKERSSKMLTGIAVLYMRNGTADDFPFYERILTSNAIYAYDKVSALNAFTYFVARQDLALQRKALPVFEFQAKYGGSGALLQGCLNYLNRSLDDRIVQFQEDEAKAKETGNTNAADIAKAKQEEARELIMSFKKLKYLLDVEKESSH
jgi:aminopeptidase N